MGAVCVSMSGTPPSTAATCLSRLAGAPCLAIIDRSRYSRRDRKAFARSGELKQQLQGWHGQLSDMAVCISINGHQITNPQLLDFLFELLPRNQGMPTPRPSAAPHWLGPCKDSCNPFMIRAADCTSSAANLRCAMMHVSAAVIRCKSSLSRTVTPAHQDACRCRYILSVYTWAPG